LASILFGNKNENKDWKTEIAARRGKGRTVAVRLNKADCEKVYAAIKRSELEQPDWLRKALLDAAES
jgi:hypothetical protein